jgi:dihydroneopterin aldolase
MTGDRIILSGLAFLGRHGVLDDERTRGQRFLIDVVLESDLGQAGRLDDLTLTVDYRRVYDLVREIAEGPPMRLLEAVAEAIAGRLLDLPRVEAATVRVRKPEVALGGPLEAAAVEIRRTRRVPPP